VCECDIYFAAELYRRNLQLKPLANRDFKMDLKVNVKQVLLILCKCNISILFHNVILYPLTVPEIVTEDASLYKNIDLQVSF
jgi:hypothetical protein